MRNVTIKLLIKIYFDMILRVPLKSTINYELFVILFAADCNESQVVAGHGLSVRALDFGD